jgi:hypothetical protein
MKRTLTWRDFCKVRDALIMARALSDYAAEETYRFFHQIGGRKGGQRAHEFALTALAEAAAALVKAAEIMKGLRP